jgi:MarR family transcriptional regulator, lower aerobic nicotinate degradation pathway regulator
MKPHITHPIRAKPARAGAGGTRTNGAATLRLDAGADEAADARVARAEASVGKALEAVRRLVRALRLSANRARESVGVSPAELFILRALNDGGPAASLNELAARTYTDQSSASPVVERLRRRRLIRRRRSAIDRRRVTIELTDSGRALLQRAPLPPQAGVITALHRMSGPERDSLARGLSRLVSEMGLDQGRGAMLFEEPSRARNRPDGE